MSRIRNWLIHKLGGYTRRDWNDLARGANGPRSNIQRPFPQQHLHPQMVKASYGYYVEPDTQEVRMAQANLARNELAKKIACEMLDQGMIRCINTVDPVQDRPPIRKFRMTAVAWALDANQMPVYGGEAQ